MKIDHTSMAPEELAARSLTGDITARNELYFRCGTTVRRSLRRAKMVLREYGSSDGALLEEDVDQQAFIIFCDLLDEWEMWRCPFEDMLRVKMPWRALHYVRSALHYRSVKKIGRIRGAFEPDEIVQRNDESAAQALVLVEGRESFPGLALTENQRLILDYRYRLDLSSDQIARLTGTSRRTVNRRLKSAGDQVRLNLVERWESCG